MKTPLFTFTAQEQRSLLDLPSVSTRSDRHWDATLRQWFDENECGLPTEETLRNHGRWLIPHWSQTRGLMHKLFRWRGNVIFEGWFDATASKHIIQSHTASTPKPWDKPSGQECRVCETGEANPRSFFQS